MKKNTLKLIFIIALVLCYSYNAGAQNSLSADNASGKSKTISPTNKVKDEKSFVKYSDKTLAIMDKKAKELSIIGVAIIGFIPGEETSSWVSKMKVVDVLANNRSNFLAIASSKACDMAVTLQNSGTVKSRKPLEGELGYQGGLIKKIKTGYVFAVFSGGSTENDLKVAQAGLDSL